MTTSGHSVILLSLQIKSCWYEYLKNEKVNLFREKLLQTVVIDVFKIYIILSTRCHSLPLFIFSINDAKALCRRYPPLHTVMKIEVTSVEFTLSQLSSHT